MIIEAVVQKAYAALFKQYNLPFWDVMPARESLPVVLLNSVQTTYNGRSGADCIAEFSVISEGTSKKELYDLAQNVIQILPEVGNYSEGQLSFSTIISTMASNYTTTNNVSPEIWQMYVIRTKIHISNRC